VPAPLSSLRRRSNSSGFLFSCGYCGVLFASRGGSRVAPACDRTAAMHQRVPTKKAFLPETRAPGLAPGNEPDETSSTLDGGHQTPRNETQDVAASSTVSGVNYRDLRERFTLRSPALHTQSDTEILAPLHAWEEWGRRALTGTLRGIRHLLGLIFASVMRRPPILFLAPLSAGHQASYSATAEGLRSLQKFARFRFWRGAQTMSQDASPISALCRVSEPVTLLEGVFSLPPGHRMAPFARSGRAAVPRARTWWGRCQSFARGSRYGRRAIFPRRPKKLRPLLRDCLLSCRIDRWTVRRHFLSMRDGDYAQIARLPLGNARNQRFR